MQTDRTLLFGLALRVSLFSCLAVFSIAVLPVNGAKAGPRCTHYAKVFERNIEKYRQERAGRYCAFAMSANGDYCGWSDFHKSRKAAENSAIANCEKQSRKPVSCAVTSLAH